MDILIDTSSITSSKTGTGTYTRGLLESLLIAPEVDRVTAIGGDIDAETLDHREKLIHFFQGENRWHYLLNNAWTGNRHNWDADIAFFPNYFMPFAFPVRSVVTIHDVSFISHPECYSRRMRLWYMQRIKQTVYHADLILTVSEPSRRNIIQQLGIPVDKIHVIEPGSSLSEANRHQEFPKKSGQTRESTTKSTGFLKFLYIGTIEPRKNILNMLRGFIATKSPDLQLQLAGQLNCSPAYWKEVKSLISMDQRIRYSGYLPDDQLKTVLSECDVLVNLSHIEGFGLPVMEALLMGKECLISEDPSLRNLVDRHGLAIQGDKTQKITEGFEIMSRRNGSIPEKEIDALYSYYNWQRFSRQLTSLIGRQPVFWSSSDWAPNNPDRVKTLSGLPGILDAIIQALSYSAVFRCPLPPDQLYRRLPGTECTFPVFRQALNHLCQDYPGLFRYDGNYAYLEPFDVGAAKRDSDLADNALFIKRHDHIINWIKRLPWVTGIYYSGGTVHSSHLLKKDLDLFIVSSTDRVWLLYTLLKGFALLVRRKRILCFNYLVDESSLVIRHQRDLYTAHQLACLRPAITNSNMPEPLQYNHWVYDFFPNLGKITKEPVKRARVSSRWWYWMNMIAMGLWTGWWSRKGLRNRAGGILWDFHRIKLHTHDHRSFVYEKYKALLNETIIKMQVLDKQKATTGDLYGPESYEQDLKKREAFL